LRRRSNSSGLQSWMVLGRASRGNRRARANGVSTMRMGRKDAKCARPRAFLQERLQPRPVDGRDTERDLAPRRSRLKPLLQVAGGTSHRRLLTSIAIKRYDFPVPARPPAMTAISFEFFPPKTDEQRAQLDRTVARLARHRPEFVSCTFGAGGSTLSYTADTVRHLLQRHGLDAAPHLSCVGGSCEEIAALLDQYRALGCRRIVALRGDLPSGMGQ